MGSLDQTGSRTGRMRVPALANGGSARPRGEDDATRKRMVGVATEVQRRGSSSSSRNRAGRKTSGPRLDLGPPLGSSSTPQTRATRSQSHSFFDDSPTSTLHYSPKAIPPSNDPCDNRVERDVASPGSGTERLPRKPAAASLNGFKEATNGSAYSQRKLAGFFGDEFLGRSPPGSVSEVAPDRTQKGRKQSIGSTFRKPSNADSNGTHSSAPSTSTSQSRPRSPAAAPSSDVTPWAFQEFNVSRVQQASLLPRF